MKEVIENPNFKTHEFNIMGNGVTIEHRKLVDWFQNDVTLIHTNKAFYRMVHSNKAVPDLRKESGTMFAGAGVRVTWNIAYDDKGQVSAIKIGPCSMGADGTIAVFDGDGRLDHSLTNLLTGFMTDHRQLHAADMKVTDERRWWVFIVLAIHLIDTNNLWARQSAGGVGKKGRS